MGILTDQMALSDAAVNAEKITIETAADGTLTLSQIRSGPNGNLLSGYWPGRIEGGTEIPRMYPDNSTVYVSVAHNESTGREKIKDAFQHSMKKETTGHATQYEQYRSHGF